MTAERNEHIVAAYAAGDDIATIAARFGVTTDDIHRIVAHETTPAGASPQFAPPPFAPPPFAHPPLAPPPFAHPPLVPPNAEAIVAAYAEGHDIGFIAGRFGISEDDVRRIVAHDTMPSIGISAVVGRGSGLAPLGWILLAFGLVGPCLAGAVWLAVYYLSAQEYPVGSWGYGNLAVGLAGILTGAVILAAAAAVLIIAKSRRR